MALVVSGVTHEVFEHHQRKETTMPATKPIDMPFHTVLKGNGTFVDGFETEDAAKADVKDRDARSEKMGLKARYEVVAK